MSEYCFLIPSYQHSQQLDFILQEISSYSMPCAVINDGSDKEHSERLRALCLKYSWVHLVEHKSNQGKGGAVMTGLAKAKSLGCSHAVQIDSDGQHDLKKINALIDESKKYPTALISGQPVYDKSVPWGRKLGRYLTHFWVWVETLSFQIKDSMCGFRVYPLDSTADVLKNKSVGRRMDFDVEILVRLFWRKVAIKFIPVKVTYPKGGSSNFNIIKDNLLITKMHTKLCLGMIIRFPFLLANKIFATKVTHWSRSEEKGMLIGIRFLFLTHKIFGHTVVQFFLKLVCFYYQIFAFQARRASKDFKATYLSYCYKNNISPKGISIFSHLYSFADSMLDKLMVYQGLYYRTIFHKQDLDKFDQLKKTKPGGVFIGAHFGNIEIARALGHENPDKNFVALTYTDNALKFNKSINLINPKASMNMISVKSFTPEVAIELKERVDRGEWVFVMGDRGSVTNVKRSIAVEILGRKAFLPFGSFLLAYLLKVPVYSIFCYKERGQFRLKFKEITPRTETGALNRSEYMDRLAKQYGQDLTEKIIEAPLQWYNFFMFWKKYD